MKSIFVLLLALSAPTFGAENLRDELIRTEIDMNSVNSHTCTRVQSMSDMSEEQCKSKLVHANEVCLEVVRTNVPSEPTIEQATSMMRLLMMCPVAVVLDMPFDGKKVWSAYDES